MSVFETQWTRDMSREAAVKLCSNAIWAGIFNDLGSGSNVDVCVITPEKTELLRNYMTPNVREEKKRNYKFARGTTAVLREKVVTREDLAKYVTVQEVTVEDVGATGEKAEGERMDVDQ